MLGSCSPQNTLRGVFKSQSGHEKYAAALKDAKLDQTGLGQQWVAASAKALQAPVPVTLPFKETGYFPADKPSAAGYRFTVKRGQKVAVRVETKGQNVPQVFLDLFETDAANPGNPKRVASADTTSLQLEYEIDEELPHILRLQPELLRSGQYTVTIETGPVLAFPVQGKDSRAVQSFWGQDRDAGARRHEGIDIFAPRRTPVVASVEGVVSRVNTTPIGGKVVWLTDVKRQQSLYYAHLDSQTVEPGQRVAVGDTLGLMGNTGNAITTAPHLHFGIYQFGQGAVDPFPYVHQDRTPPAALQIDTKNLNAWTRVTKEKTTVREAPATSSASLATLGRHAPVQVLGGSGSWYRVQLADGRQGYISGSLLEGVEKPLQSLKLKREAPLLETSNPEAAAKQTLTPDSTVRVLAKLDDFWLVKDQKGETGWIPASATR